MARTRPAETNVDPASAEILNQVQHDDVPVRVRLVLSPFFREVGGKGRCSGDARPSRPTAPGPIRNCSERPSRTMTPELNATPGALRKTPRYGGEDRIRTCGEFAPTHAFQACPLNRSGTSPRQRFRQIEISLRSSLLEGGGPTSMYIWRRERDSNPRYADAYTGFRDRRLQPLSHLSELINYNNRTARYGCYIQWNLTNLCQRIHNYA